jgi:hypothetical protein
MHDPRLSSSSARAGDPRGDRRITRRRNGTVAAAFQPAGGRTFPCPYSKWAPATRTASAASGIFHAVMSDYLSACKPEHARCGHSVRAGDEGPSVPIIVEPLTQPTEVPAPPAPQEPVREPEKVPA